MNALTQPLAAIRDTDEQHFDADVSSAPLVLVKFTGTWCPPCQAIQPVLEALARVRKDLTVLEIDVDAHQALAQRFGVRSIPTLIAFRDGKPFAQRVGSQSRAALDKMLT